MRYSPRFAFLILVEVVGTDATAKNKIALRDSDQISASGVHTFTGLKLNRKGQQTISLIDTLFPTIATSLTLAVS